MSKNSPGENLDLALSTPGKHGSLNFKVIRNEDMGDVVVEDDIVGAANPQEELEAFNFLIDKAISKGDIPTEAKSRLMDQFRHNYGSLLNAARPGTV